MKNIELGISDRIAWRSGKSFYTGLVAAVIKPGVSIKQIRREMDPKKEIPDYLFNLGRDKTKTNRIVIQTTHRYKNPDWEKYPNDRITAFNAESLAEKLFAYRKPNQKKDRVVNGDNARIEWVDVELTAAVASKKKENKTLDFEDIADLSIAGLDDCIVIAGL